MVADLAEKFSVGREFEELRSARAICRTRAVARVKTKTWPLEFTATPWLHRDRSRAEVSGSRTRETDFGRLLGERGEATKRHKTRSECFHRIHS